jgi:DNA-binding transcriptional LysR family regulator
MDLAVGYFAEPHGSLLQQLLYRRDCVCIARADHPRIGASMTLREFSRKPQVGTPAMGGTQVWMDARLRRSRLQRGVQMTTQHMAAIPFIVAASDYVAVIPREVYELFRPIAPIRSVRLPLAIPPIEIRQYWHPRAAGDPAVKFLRELVYAAARG